MKVLLTGSHGYIGRVLIGELINEGYSVVGLDNVYYQPLRPAQVDHTSSLDSFIHSDIRNIKTLDLSSIDAVVHLAGLSNDPLGQLNPDLTESINYHSTIELAHKAKTAGVKRFIYASSQSMYGVSDNDNELDEDKSIKNPVTAYAETKWRAEQELFKLNGKDFSIVAYRPSTVFGASTALRTDIVYNNFLACAYTTGKIEIKSDGTPWRPVVHVKDVCSAFISGLKAPLELVAGEAFNVGIPNGNFKVRDLAEAAQSLLPNTEIIYTNEHGNDSRTYRVSFQKILTRLKDYYVPKWDLINGGQELLNYFQEVNFTQSDFRGDRTNRLNSLNQSINSSKLDTELKWL